VNCKNIGLTFAQCEYTKEDAKANVDRELEGKLDGYVIAQEHHKDGGLHLHLYLKFKEKVDYRKADCLDWIVAGTQHANIQTLRYPKKWITYLRKSDESPVIEGDVAEDLTWNEIMNATTREDCFNKLLEVRPRDAALNADRVLRGWQLNKQINKKRKYERKEPPKNCVLFGLSGVGKSYAAEGYAIENDMSMYKINMQQLKEGWYTGWGQEDIMWLDDFRHECMKPHEFLNLLDGLEEVPIKGGSTPFKAQVLLITSPDHPINWWPKWQKKDKNNTTQLLRRLQSIVHCRKEGEDYIKEILNDWTETADLFKNIEEEVVRVGFDRVV